MNNENALALEMSLAEVFEVLKNTPAKEIDTNRLWYDWFCSDKALVNRGAKLLTKLKSISGSKKFNPEKTYVFFKNNCPCDGPLYDDFRICDKESGNVLYTVVPKDESGKSEVWGREEDGKGDPNGEFRPLLKEATWKDVKAFFLS